MYTTIRPGETQYNAEEEAVRSNARKGRKERVKGDEVRGLT